MSLPFLAKKPIDLPPIVSVELIQITWFKKEPKLHMIETDDEDLVYNSMMEIIND